MDFPLANPIMHTIEKKVKDKGSMVFAVKYENIPHFCFGCGRIGHAQEECPDEGHTTGGVRFGKALRGSPQKIGVGKSMTIPAEDPRARHALNFSGDQHRRMMAAAYSSNSHRGEGAMSNRRKYREEESPVSFPGKGKHDSEIPEELVDGVKNMAVDPRLLDLNAQPSEHEPGKVSGLDSYLGSSDTTGGGAMETNGTEHLSMLERLAGAKGTKIGAAGDKRTVLGVRRASKDSEKAKHNKKAVHIAATIQELEEAGLIAEGLKIKKESVWAEEADRSTGVKDGESPAKRSRRPPSCTTPLTGARDEPRQAQ